jgi:Transglutaminase-like superfamily
MNRRLVLRSYVLLVKVDLMMRFRSLQAVHSLVRDQSVAASAAATRPGVEAICRAVDLACVFHVKPVLCLQRSAAATVLLRRCGWDARLSIGAQVFPFKSHAWVEVDGRVVNDKPYVQQIYSVLERC